MRLSNRTIEALEVQAADYFVWDEELPGFGVRVYASGRKAYLVQYRVNRRTRRLTLGIHGALTPEMARKEAKIRLGDIAKGGDPAEERKTNREGLTVRELCDRYLADAEIGLVPGKRRMPKKASTLKSDRSRIDAHIVPLLGSRLVKEVTRADIHQFMRDVAQGKARRDRKTKPRGRSIVRGGLGTAGRTLGLLGGLYTYAVRIGIVETNPVHGIVKPASNVRQRRLTEAEYRTFGEILREAEAEGHNETALTIIKVLALTGCRRGEIEKLRWEEVDEAGRCFRLADTKEGRSIRPIGPEVFALLNQRRPAKAKGYVFEGDVAGKPFDGVPKVWGKTVRLQLEDVTPHALRHSFASMANDLGFTEATIAALLGHAAGTTTSRYVHNLDGVLIAAAEKVSGHIAGLIRQMDDERQGMRALFEQWGTVTEQWADAA
ncbi:integrase [Caulobacter sp. Root655]|uniref:tyrosine-type recombinase/integrase n=1 Tax=Caulobacter sp. Root655 TaxID=1736578 RepID=UPI0006F8FF86|nr:site-specific integrase [Caulobacter sp. Root655]KRA56244.1 integrase [Caulobacter sp. Root655]